MIEPAASFRVRHDRGGMNMKRFAALCLVAALGACATGGGNDGPRSAAALLPGRTRDVEAAKRQGSTRVGSDAGAGGGLFGCGEVSRRWAMEGGPSCFTWAGNFRECWPYADPLRRGVTRTITSSR